MTIKILLVENNTENLLEELLFKVNSFQKEIVPVKSLEEAVKELSDRPFDVVLLDLFLPDSQGLTTLSRLLEVTREILIISIADKEREPLAKETLKLGAQDYLIQGQITPELLGRSLRYAMEFSRSWRLRQESDRRFQAIFDQSLDFILLLTPDGIVSKINHNILDFSGFSPKEIEGFYLWEIPIFHQSLANKKKLKNAFNKAANGEKVSYEIDIFSAKKLVKTVDFFLIPIKNEKGEVAMLIAKAREVSHRPLVPTENIESQGIFSSEATTNQEPKERELAQMKSKFVTMVSHEFRTPLSTILLSSGLLETYSHQWSEERKKTHFHRIKSAINRLTELLDEVLVIGKAEAGKFQLKPEPLNLEAFCRTLLEEWKSYVNNRLIRFSYHGNIPTVEMDAELLKQIFSHLLSNALKYSPVEEAIDFEVNCVASLDSQKNGVAIFKIRDRGIGIPPEEQKQLFETFFRASNVGTISGTGLGLAIVRALVDLHGGQITVESEVDVGTIVTVKLPLNWGIGNGEWGMENGE
jgi:PAS domain S-box-containing protein